MKKLSLYLFLVLLMISACSEQNQISECIKGDCNNGRGTFIESDGQKYVGQWKDGVQNGYGTWTRPDGEKYVGKWKDGQFHGQGTLTYTNGTVEKGFWKDGNIVEPQ